jgi:hypothetical protein
MSVEIGALRRKRFWLNWLDEEIEYGTEYHPRQFVIYCFVKEDLIPFVKAQGYVFLTNERVLAQIIARELFHCLCNKNKKIAWHSKRHNRSYREDDKQHFDDIFDTFTWERFWKKTVKWEDIEENIKTQTIIEFAVWTCIDIPNSQQTQYLNNLANDGESDDDSDSNTREKERDYGYNSEN